MRPLAFVALACAAISCGPIYEEADWTTGMPRPRGGHGSMHVRWRVDLAPDLGGAFIPVESATPALDPRADRLFVGSSQGSLWALRSNGGKLWRYDTGGGIGCAPVVDSRADQLFVGTTEGILHSLVAESGRHRWHVPVGGAVAGLALSADAVYVVTEDDIVVAFARADGEELWRVKRDAPPGLSLVGHSGLTLDGDVVYGGFSDGVVMALDAADGTARWERDTSLDLSEEGTDGVSNFLDVDTTPVLRGDAVWVASATAGLYSLSRATGAVLYRDGGRTGIIAMARWGADGLLFASSEDGIVAYDAELHTARWHRAVVRGAATLPVVMGNVAIYGETRGGLVEIALDDGLELARVESGNGFAAPVAAGGFAFAVSNGGGVYAVGL